MSNNAQQLKGAFLSAWNSHDPGCLARLIAPDYEGFDVGYTALQFGAEGACQMAQRYWRAFPDLRLEDDGHVLDENQMAVFWTIRGTHCGELMNIPPTGRWVAVRGVAFLTVQEGKISRALYLWDVAGLLRSFGLLPDL